MNKFVYISKNSFHRLGEKLEIFPLIKEVIELDGKIIYKIPAKKSFGKLPHYIYNGSSGNWYSTKNKKQPIKLGKIISVITDYLDSTEIESKVKLWNFEYQPNTDIIKISEKLTEVYDMPHFCSGSIGGSCMKNKGEFYEFLEEYVNVKIAYVTNQDKELVARALIWEDVYFPQLGRKVDFMDRIYYAKEKYLELFKKYAQENNMVYKKYQSYEDKDSFVFDSDEFYDTIEINTMAHSYSLNNTYMPYMDTLSYCDFNLKKLSNEVFDNYQLNSTNGDFEELYFGHCINCGDGLTEDEATYIDVSCYCEHCRDNYFVWSDYQDCYISRDDAIWVDDIDDYTFDYEVIYDEVCDLTLTDGNVLYSSSKGDVSDYSIDNELLDDFVCYTKDITTTDGSNIKDIHEYDIVLKSDDIAQYLSGYDHEWTYNPNVEE